VLDKQGRVNGRSAPGGGRWQVPYTEILTVCGRKTGPTLPPAELLYRIAIAYQRQNDGILNDTMTAEKQLNEVELVASIHQHDPAVTRAPENRPNAALDGNFKAAASVSVPKREGTSGRYREGLTLM